jgi:hypothetical protein
MTGFSENAPTHCGRIRCNQNSHHLTEPLEGYVVRFSKQEFSAVSKTGHFSF